MNHESLKKQLHADILGRVIRLIIDSPNKRSLISSTEKPYIYAWQVEASEKRYEHPLYGFSVYTEARLCEDRAEQAEGKPASFATLHLPAPNLEDGTPTQNLYFIEQDDTIHYWHEAAVLAEDGTWQDFKDIEEKPNLPLNDMYKLLGNLERMRSI